MKKYLLLLTLTGLLRQQEGVNAGGGLGGLGGGRDG